MTPHPMIAALTCSLGPDLFQEPAPILGSRSSTTRPNFPSLAPLAARHLSPCQRGRRFGACAEASSERGSFHGRRKRVLQKSCHSRRGEPPWRVAEGRESRTAGILRSPRAGRWIPFPSRRAKRRGVRPGMTTPAHMQRPHQGRGNAQPVTKMSAYRLHGVVKMNTTWPPCDFARARPWRKAGPSNNTSMLSAVACRLWTLAAEVCSITVC
jgi:hypothetical protein